MLIAKGIHQDYLHILVNLSGVGKAVECDKPHECAGLVGGAAVLFCPNEPQAVLDRVTAGARSPRHRRRRPEIMTTETQDGPDAVVIGAGPAGLAVARELDHQHGIKALVLDRAAAPAISWRTRYDNFRLNTTGFLSHLPGQRIPLNAGRWPTKEDMVRYFDHYVQRQNIALCSDAKSTASTVPGESGNLTRRRVKSVPRQSSSPRATTAHPPSLPGPDSVASTARSFTPGTSPTLGHTVAATSSLLAQAIRPPTSLSSSLTTARGGSGLRCAHRRTWCGGPSDRFRRISSLSCSRRVPARMVDPLIARMNRLMWGDLSAYGFQRPPLGLKATVEKRGRIPTLADELIDVVRVGRVEVVGAVKAVESDGVILADGTSVAPQVIIAATGFGTDLDGLVGHLGVLTSTATRAAALPRTSATECSRSDTAFRPMAHCGRSASTRRRWPREVAAYLKRFGPVGSRTLDDVVSLAMHAEHAGAKSKGTQ